MADNGPKLHEAIDAVRAETGARMVVLGESHNMLGNVKHLRESLESLKKSGFSTLYVELGADEQGLVDRALTGNRDAQRDLRLKYERWWYYGGTEGAQERYDLLFEANKAGLKVKCVDMDGKNDHMWRYNNFGLDEDPNMLTSRLAISDTVVARNIKRLDDGQPALLLIGKAHTYSPAEGGHVELDDATGNMSQHFQSGHGGSDSRLNAAGIKTVSIDFTAGIEGATALEKGDGASADYNFFIEHEPLPKDPPYHVSTGYRVYWDRMADIYEHASIVEGAKDKVAGKKYEEFSKEVAGLSKTLDDPKFLKLSVDDQVKSLAHTMTRMGEKAAGLEMNINDELLLNAAGMTHVRWLMPQEGETMEDVARKIVLDNQFIHSPAAKSMWEKDPMTLAGKAQQSAVPDLQVSWNVAQTSTGGDVSSPESSPRSQKPLVSGPDMASMPR